MGRVWASRPEPVARWAVCDGEGRLWVPAVDTVAEAAQVVASLLKRPGSVLLCRDEMGATGERGWAWVEGTPRQTAHVREAARRAWLRQLRDRFPAIIAERPGVSITEMCAAWGVSQPTVTGWVRHHQARGVHVVSGRGQRGIAYVAVSSPFLPDAPINPVVARAVELLPDRTTDTTAGTSATVEGDATRALSYAGERPRRA